MDVLQQIENMDTNNEEYESVYLELQEYLNSYEMQEEYFNFLPIENPQDGNALETSESDSKPISEVPLAKEIPSKASPQTAFPESEQSMVSSIGTSQPKIESTDTKAIHPNVSGQDSEACPTLHKRLSKGVVHGPPESMCAGCTEGKETHKTTFSIFINGIPVKTHPPIPHESVEETDDFVFKIPEVPKRKVFKKIEPQVILKTPSQASSESPQQKTQRTEHIPIVLPTSPVTFPDKKKTIKTKKTNSKVSSEQTSEQSASPRVSTRQRKAPTRYGEWIPLELLCGRSRKRPRRSCRPSPDEPVSVGQ